MSTPAAPAFKYVDLFAGIGGFHAVLDAMGGECVYAVEIDPAAQAVYEANWGSRPLGMNSKGDITLDTASPDTAVPEHDVLVAGFPCQPFSKSGKQQGMDETRGTLFFNIMEIVRHRRPAVVLLENVRNLAGPRHTHEWEVIVQRLRDAGYRVSHKADVLSPAAFAPEFGGHPQTRDRVFIAATRIEPSQPSDVYHRLAKDGELALPDPHAPYDEPLPVGNLRMTEEWNLVEHLPLDTAVKDDGTVSAAEWNWIEHWDSWVQQTRQMLASEADRDGVKAKDLPGFPIWANVWTADEQAQRAAIQAASGMAWKVSHLEKNYELFERLRRYDAEWLGRWLGKTRQFPESRQKLEWQAQWTPSIRECVISLRPSGLRVKRLTHLPALVAISQTPIIGPLRRRLSAREGTLLQGLPEGFKWPQKNAATWKQLGNGVNTGVVARALWAQVTRDLDLLQLDERGQSIHDAVTKTLADDGNLKVSIQAAWERSQARIAEHSEAQGSPRGSRGGHIISSLFAASAMASR